MVHLLHDGPAGSGTALVAPVENRHPFHWHWAIPAIGVTLLAADIFYFTAIAQPNALISLVSPIRRASVAVSFLLGILVFRERHIRAKGACVLGIIAGLLLLAQRLP